MLDSVGAPAVLDQTIVTGISSEVASRKKPDGTISFITIMPGLEGFEFVVGGAGDGRTLVTRDSQHEYVSSGS